MFQDHWPLPMDLLLKTVRKKLVIYSRLKLPTFVNCGKNLWISANNRDSIWPRTWHQETRTSVCVLDKYNTCYLTPPLIKLSNGAFIISNWFLVTKTGLRQLYSFIKKSWVCSSVRLCCQVSYFAPTETHQNFPLLQRTYYEDNKYLRYKQAI